MIIIENIIKEAKEVVPILFIEKNKLELEN
jgi:hypothetical protein